MKKNPVAEPIEIEAAPREVRNVRKGRMWVAVMEEGTPLRSGHDGFDARALSMTFAVALDLID